MNSFSALKNPVFRGYFYGQLVSLTGNWMQGVALAWFVFRLTHSNTWVGAVTFFIQTTAFFLSPLAGVFADSKDRAKVLVVTNLFACILSFALSALATREAFSPELLVPLLIALGAASAFDMTTRHALALDLVHKNELGSALTLNSIAVNGSRVLGPAFAGLLVPTLGEPICFFLNGLSYLPVIWGLSRLRVSRPMLTEKSNFFAQVREALSYASHHSRIRNLLLLSAGATFFAFPYTVLLPAISKKVLNGGSGTLATLSIFSGIGGIVGALLIGQRAMRSNERSQNRILMLSLWGLGTSLIALGGFKTLWGCSLSTFGIGLFFMSIFPAINNALQLLSEPKLRGRILSFYTMTFLGTAPLGSLLQGWTADRLGPQKTALAAGLCCALLSMSYFFAYFNWEPHKT